MNTQALPPDDPRHGTINAYVYYRCRCDPCRRANAAYHREAKERRTRLLRSGEQAVNHGHYATYINYRCRCAECRAANTQHAREYRKASA